MKTQRYGGNLLIAALVAWLASGCTDDESATPHGGDADSAPNGGRGDADIPNAGAGPGDALLPCPQLDERTCILREMLKLGKENACHALQASWLADDGSAKAGYVGCRELKICNALETCARDPDGKLYIFPMGGGCIPEGWDDGFQEGEPFREACEDLQKAVRDALHDADAGVGG